MKYVKLLVNAVSTVLVTVVVAVVSVSAVATGEAFALVFQHVKPKIILVRESAPKPEHTDHESPPA